MKLHSVGAVATVVASVLVGNGAASAPQTASPPGVYVRRASVFLTLPMASGFADATYALSDSKELVRRAVEAAGDIDLVGARQDADVVLTVLGRGRGHAELGAALRALDGSVISPPVAIGATERFIEAMLTVGACPDAQPAARERTGATCYRRVFVGLGYADRDTRRAGKRPAANSWEACAEAVVMDVRAWLGENAPRILALRASRL